MSQGEGGLTPRYQGYRRQKCFLGYPEKAPWAQSLLDTCKEVLDRPEFDLELDHANLHFETGGSLRQKVLELIAHARYGIYDLSWWQDQDHRWHMPRTV